MELVASTLHTTSEHGVSSITTADAHTSAVSSRLNWRPRRFKWTRPFRRKTKSDFCACTITFQLASTQNVCLCMHCELVYWPMFVYEPSVRWTLSSVLLTKYYLGALMKGDEVSGGGYVMRGREEKCLPGVVGKTWRSRCKLEDNIRIDVA